MPSYRGSLCSGQALAATEPPCRRRKSAAAVLLHCPQEGGVSGFRWSDPWRALSLPLSSVSPPSCPRRPSFASGRARAAMCSITSTSFQGASVGRPRRHRRAVPLSLHACAQHHSAKPHLRHAAGGSRLPCAEIGRSRDRPELCRARRDACRHRHLSARDQSLDQETWRPQTETDPVARTGARTLLPALRVTRL